MKRIVSLLLALVMCFALVACGGSDTGTAGDNSETQTNSWPRMTIGGADSTGTM